MTGKKERKEDKQKESKKKSRKESYKKKDIRKKQKDLLSTVRIFVQYLIWYDLLTI